MSALFTVIGVALLAAVLSVFLKSGRMPVFALLVSLAAGILIFVFLLPRLLDVIVVFRQLASAVDLNTDYLSLILKIIAVCYLAEFMGQVCRDSGENGLAMKIDLSAKITVMVMAVPVVISVLEQVLTLLPD